MFRIGHINRPEDLMMPALSGDGSRSVSDISYRGYIQMLETVNAVLIQEEGGTRRGEWEKGVRQEDMTFMSLR